MDLTPGDFVELRGRPWLVEAIDVDTPLRPVRLSCIADDAQGEPLEVLWDAEIDARVLNRNDWARVGRGGPDSSEVLAAYLRVMQWGSATAAERDLPAQILRAALERIAICSNDPVCCDHDPEHQTGDRATHGAACHGCLLIAETSCESRNLFLDRSLLVPTMSTPRFACFAINE